MSTSPNELLLEGYRQQQQGNRGEAERLYHEVLLIEPANVHALNLLGIIFLETQRFEQAVQFISSALVLEPDDPESLANLGLALKEVGQLDEAEQALRRSLARNPGNPVANNNLGNILAELQRVEESIEFFRAALHIDGDYVECLINLSGALLALERNDGALAAAHRALVLRPSSPEAQSCVADAMLKFARYADAADLYRSALKLRPDYIEAMLGLSSAIKEIGDPLESEKLLREIIRREPACGPAHNSLGVFLEQKGDASGAAAQFRLAIQASPQYANAYFQLAQLKGAVLSDDEITSIRKFFAHPATGSQQRMPLAFALARIHEADGDYDGAFHYLAIGQALKSKVNPYNDQSVAAYYGRIRNTVDSRMPGRPRRALPDGPRPLFVLGMPRSGTSLTEQILASHPDIEGAGEMSLLEDTVNAAVRLCGIAFPECIAKLTEDQRNLLGDDYVRRLAQRAGSTTWIVDKTPMNFQYVGFIAAILPQARIIHCRRSPIENCLSIFKLPFESTHTYAHDLTALGQFYRHYAALMAHWKDVVGAQMLDIEYESLVDNLELQSRRMLDFLELPFAPQVLAFHSTPRMVKTPSASQVRRPIYKDSLESWRKYESHLQSLILALEPASAPAR